MEGLYLRGVRARLDGLPPDSYLRNIPAVRALDGLDFHRPVTFLVGENGMGKSTLIEAVAAAWGFNPEGGSRNFSFFTAATHSPLWNCLTLIKGPYRPRDGFFLRAESFYNVASNIDAMDREPSFGPSLISSYGGKSLHAQSHGESFLSLLLNRFGGRGLYILDEPEAALSPSRQLSLLARLHDLTETGSQFLIATHSPILTAYPGAEIYTLSEEGIAPTAYRDTDNYRITKRFLDDPASLLRELFGEDD